MQKITFSSSIHLGGDHLPAINEAQVFYAVLAFVATLKSDDESRLPLNICFVVDCSTSMRGRPLEIMKRSLSTIGKWLNDEDYVSIVSFNDRAETIIKTSKVNELDNLSRQLAKIHALGGTEIYQGLKRGYVQLIRTPNFKETIPHLVLITDGRTYGDEDMCLRLVKSSRSEGIVFSAIGIGDDWNDDLLDHLSAVSGGETRYLSNFDRLPKEIELLLLKFGQSTIPSVHFDFSLATGCEITNIYRLSPEVTPLSAVDGICNIGVLVPDLPLQLLFEFRVQPIHISQPQLNLLEGYLKINSTTSRTKFATSPTIVSVPVMLGSVKTALPSNLVMTAVYNVSIYRMQENARKLIQQGNIAEGVNILKNLARQLNAQGNQMLAEQIEKETVFISENRNYSESGEKHIKYATRLLPAKTQKAILTDATKKVVL